jgi:hypothetical protein
MKQKSMTLSLFGSKSKVKAIKGGRLKAVKSVTVPGKCSAISDGDRPVFPSIFVFVSNCSRSGLAKNLVQICFFQFVVP